ncbi:MAG: hypothetical protein K9L61_00650 [Candidatus Omnitrophica bacterium]|nr:hypothetical protein [Candidatus Omnitrophota bacterium]
MRNKTKMKKKQKAQAILEYTIVFAIVLAALVASSFFMDVKTMSRQHLRDAVTQIPGVGSL